MPETIEGIEYLSVAEVARLRGSTTTAIYKAVEQERLAARKFLGRVLIARADALAWEPQEHGGARPGAGRSRKGESADS